MHCQSRSPSARLPPTARLLLSNNSFARSPASAEPFRTKWGPLMAYKITFVLDGARLGVLDRKLNTLRR